MIVSIFPVGFWLAAAGTAASYIALFLLARRAVALRLGRLRWLALAVLALRLALLGAYPLATAFDACFSALGLLSLAGLWLGARTWLLRATAEDVREQIETGCRGLFLVCAEPERGRFVLTAKGTTTQLRMRSLGRRMMCLRVPRLAGQRKVELLIQWLSKQYPGPVPRITIVLKRSES